MNGVGGSVLFSSFFFAAANGMQNRLGLNTEKKNNTRTPIEYKKQQNFNLF